MQTEERHLITHLDPKSPVAEAYRTLRTNLQFASLGEPLQTIVITSTGPDEGKTTTLANLGVAMAQAGQKVLCVDCDMRKPVLASVFGKSRRVGLTNVLLEQASLQECIQQTSVPNLSLLASGPKPPNPSELLGSPRMTSLVEELSKAADVVLFDTPPVIAVTDAAVLSSRVDGVVLVVRSGVTNRDMAREAKRLLANVNARVLGVVLNDITAESGYGYYYYYYYYSQDGAEETEQM